MQRMVFKCATLPCKKHEHDIYQAVYIIVLFDIKSETSCVYIHVLVHVSHSECIASIESDECASEIDPYVWSLLYLKFVDSHGTRARVDIPNIIDYFINHTTILYVPLAFHGAF